MAKQKRFWRFVIDKSATVPKLKKPKSKPQTEPRREAKCRQLFVEFRPEFRPGRDGTGTGQGKRQRTALDRIAAVCGFSTQHLTLGVRSKLIHTLPIHCWNNNSNHRALHTYANCFLRIKCQLPTLCIH